MKRTFAFICFVLLLIQAGIMAQDSVHYVEELPFQRGESGKYRVYYDSWLTSGISAGVGLISIKEDVTQFNGKNTLHLGVIGKSVALPIPGSGESTKYSILVMSETEVPPTVGLTYTGLVSDNPHVPSVFFALT